MARFEEFMMAIEPTDRDVVTSKNLDAAGSTASKIARENSDLSGAQCAERAVRRIFGAWLLDWSGSIKPECLPLYFRLISKVEDKLDLHRRRRPRLNDPLPPLPQRARIPKVSVKPVIAHAALTLAA
jgi:hypothetical protein